MIRAIAGNGRVITAAAPITISMFLGFVLGDDAVIKMTGLGLATAFFVDATIVRMVLVPAAMKPMGDANWWIPGWLDRSSRCSTRRRDRPPRARTGGRHR